MIDEAEPLTEEELAEKEKLLEEVSWSKMFAKYVCLSSISVFRLSQLVMFVHFCSRVLPTGLNAILTNL